MTESTTGFTHYELDVNPPHDQSAHGNGIQASNGNRCPCCDNPRWCFILDDGNAVICGRTDVAPDGWERTGTAKDGRGIYAKEGSQRRRRRGLPSPDEILPLALDPKTDSPQWVTLSTVGSFSEQQIEYFYPNPETGKPLGKVVRKQWTDRRAAYGHRGKPETKEIRPHHWAKPSHPDLGAGWWSDRSKGEKEYGYKWPLYRQTEARDEIASGRAEALFYVAGEQAVETAREVGLTAICNQGGEGTRVKEVVDFVSANKPELFVIWPDNDETGMKSAAKLLRAAAKAGIPTIVLEPENIWQDLPPKGDIYNVVTKSGMDTPEFIRRLEAEIHRALESRRGESESVDIPDGFDPDSEFVQKARRELYGDKPWICVDGTLHYWTGNHYKASLDVVESQRLWRYCNGYAVQDDQGNVKYPYASPTWVKKALEWVKIAYGIDSALTDPPGLNCINGVLQISWDGSQPIWKLIDHDPALYYTYEPVVIYNPDADPSNCERLLAVLDEPQQDVFLKTVAASLDLATVRQFKGRLVRGLLLKGHGSNGKDTLRECVAAMYGYRGMTGATLTDFASYDQGRKFPLSRLRRSRVNWASENANTAKLDKIQSLKAFITGDPLSIEGKGRDEYEFNPLGVALFNVNDTPNLQASLEAIQSRYGVLTFSKTFKIGADPSKGELEADPRFKYDPSFLRSEVLPAFLNRVLDALLRLMAEGIDYSCTQQALEAIQAENSHLFQFCQDTGLSYDPNGKVYAGEIWEQLKQWYVDQGALTYEESANGKQKAIWSPFSDRRCDELIKSANQVCGRFQSLFPKVKMKVSHQKRYFTGLAFNSVGEPGGSQKGSQLTPQGSQGGSQKGSLQPLQNQERESIEPVFYTSDENLEKNFEFTKDEIKILEVSPDEKLAQLTPFADRARVTDSPIYSPIDFPGEPIDSPIDSPAAIPAQPLTAYRLGRPVRFHCQGSQRNGKLGTIHQIVDGVAEICLEDIPKDLPRTVSCNLLTMNQLMWVELVE